MGVKQLWRILSCSGRRIDISTLRGQKLAIDASIWLTQFLKAMRDEEGNMLPNAHLIGAIRRITRLMYHKIKPVFVFDGGVPALKRKTNEARRLRGSVSRASAQRQMEKYLLSQVILGQSTAPPSGAAPSFVPPRASQPEPAPEAALEEELDVEELAVEDQYQAIYEEKQRLRERKRDTLLPVSGNPDQYSQLQLTSFLKQAKRNRELDGMAKQLNSAAAAAAFALPRSRDIFVIHSDDEDEMEETLQRAIEASNQGQSEEDEDPALALAIELSKQQPPPKRGQYDSSRDFECQVDLAEALHLSTISTAPPVSTTASTPEAPVKQDESFLREREFQSHLAEAIRLSALSTPVSSDFTTTTSSPKRSLASARLDVSTTTTSARTAPTNYAAVEWEEDEEVAAALVAKHVQPGRFERLSDGGVEVTVSLAAVCPASAVLFEPLMYEQEGGAEEGGRALVSPYVAPAIISASEAVSRALVLSEHLSTSRGEVLKLQLGLGSPSPPISPAPVTLAALQEEQTSTKKALARASRDAASVTPEMRAEVLELLRLFGLPVVMAPMEAEAQCAWLETQGLVQGVVTEDSDALLFGARHVYRNIFAEKKFVEVYEAGEIERLLGLSRTELIKLALLLGSDYTPGIKGIGTVNALEVLRAFQGDSGLEEFREWVRTAARDDLLKANDQGEKKNKAAAGDEPRQTFIKSHKESRRKWIVPDDFPSSDVIKAYNEPAVDRVDVLDVVKPDVKGLVRFCQDRLGWSKEQIQEGVLAPVEAYLMSHTLVQTSLDNFVSGIGEKKRFAAVKSKRMARAIKGLAKGEEDDEEILVVDKEGNPLGLSEAVEKWKPKKRRTTTQQNTTKHKRSKVILESDGESEE